MRTLFLLIVCTTLLQAQQRTTTAPSGEDYQKLLILKSFEKEAKCLGLPYDKPDYSQNDGGLAYQVFNTAYSQAVEHKVIIPDGWYKAKVTYSNSNTSTQSNYLLDVEVKTGSVIKIDFGNSGSVHSGLNSSGYTYKGGDLEYDRDMISGNILAGLTSVKIINATSILTYRISITL
jgi:hypothetical protein